MGNIVDKFLHPEKHDSIPNMPEPQLNPDGKTRVCVIGGGVAGVMVAWQLGVNDSQKRYDVTLYEGCDRLGGAVRTLAATNPDGQTFNVDTGVIFTNENFYPNFYQVLKQFKLNTTTAELGTTGAFATPDGGEECWGNVLRGTRLRKQFAEEANRFMVEVTALADAAHPALLFAETAEMFIKKGGYSDEFIQKALVPMLLDFAITRNGLLDVPQGLLHLYIGGGGLSFESGMSEGRRVVDGSSTYMNVLEKQLGSIVHLNSNVTSAVRRSDGTGFDVTVNGQTSFFDHVVFAILKDDALKLMGSSATFKEKEILGLLSYEEMTVYTHNDPTVLSPCLFFDGQWQFNFFNYRYTGNDFGNYIKGSTTYVPRFDQDTRYTTQDSVPLPLVTYTNKGNDDHVPKADKVLDTKEFRHVRQNPQMFAAGATMHFIQGTNRAWFCGNDVIINFHEGALCSGLIIGEAFGVPYPYTASRKASWVYNLFKGWMNAGIAPLDLMYLNPH